MNEAASEKLAEMGTVAAAAAAAAPALLLAPHSSIVCCHVGQEKTTSYRQIYCPNI